MPSEDFSMTQQEQIRNETGDSCRKSKCFFYFVIDECLDFASNTCHIIRIHYYLLPLQIFHLRIDISVRKRVINAYYIRIVKEKNELVVCRRVSRLNKEFLIFLSSFMSAKKIRCKLCLNVYVKA